MRNRIVVAVCVVGLVSIIGGIALFVSSSATDPENPPGQKQRERAQAGQGIFVGGPFFNVLFDERRPDASQSVDNGTQASSPVVRSTSSPAGGGGAPPVARPAAPAVQTAVPACSPSLLASVVGLLGGVLGGGGGGC